MFELNEAVRGRLIGPRTWGRIVGNFFRIFLQSVTVGTVMGCQIHKLLNELHCDECLKHSYYTRVGFSFSRLFYSNFIVFVARLLIWCLVWMQVH